MDAGRAPAINSVAEEEAGNNSGQPEGYLAGRLVTTNVL